MNAVSDNFKRPRIKHFVGLIRVSTEKQAEDNMSLSAQEQRLRAFVIERGVADLDVFREVGSASKKQTAFARPVLHAAIKAAREKGATLIVIHIDRLSRNPEVLPFLKGCKVHSVEQGHVGQKRLKELVNEASRVSQIISEGSSASAVSRRARGEKLGNTRTLDVAQRNGCQSNQSRARKKELRLANLFREQPTLTSLTHRELCDALNHLGFLNQRSAWEQVLWTKETIRRTRKKAMDIFNKE